MAAVLCDCLPLTRSLSFFNFTLRLSKLHIIIDRERRERDRERERERRRERERKRERERERKDRESFFLKYTFDKQ